MAPLCQRPSGGGGGKRLAGVGANALDHGAQAVGALRRQMFAKSEFVEHRKGVGCKNFLRRVAGIQRQQDRDQSAHDMRVAVAEIVQQRFVGSAAVDLLCEPNLAGAALHLVYGGMLGFRHGIQRAAEFDDIPIAVVPIVQERKIIPDFVDRHRVPALNPKAIYRIAADRKRYNRAKMYMVPGLICSQGAARHSAIRSSGVNVSRGAAAANEAPPSSTPPTEPVWSDARLSVMI